MSKKILIFSSYGGGGHTSTDRALADYLARDYDVEVVYPFDTLLHALDPVRFFSFKKYSGEKIYNYFLRKKWTGLLNFLYRCAAATVTVEHAIIKKMFSTYLQKRRPDLVISVIPLINGALEQSCADLAIPLLIIPTDLDATTFIHDLSLKHQRTCSIALAFDEYVFRIPFRTLSFQDNDIHVTGFPLKQSFFQHKDRQALKKEFGIADEKFVIMVLMGSAGSTALYEYAKQLFQLSFPVHLILCTGRHESLCTKLERLSRNQQASVTIMGFTDRIADLLAVADVYITKAGTVSVVEAVYMNVPIILDATSTPLLWEKYNATFIREHEFGVVVHSYAEINSTVRSVLERHKEFRTRLGQFHKVQFCHTIVPLVEKLIAK